MNKQVVTISAITSAFVVLVSHFVISSFDSDGSLISDQPTETGLSRVNKKQVIDCGYIAYPPAIFNDSNGDVVGIFAESMELAASNLGWEVNWIEGNWPDLIPNLNSNRWDAFCGAAWKNSKRILAADFGVPLYYSYLSVWGRPEMQQIEPNDLNSSKYRVAVLDGDTSMAVADQSFPNATRLGLTELNSYSDIFNSIVGGRADFTIAEASFVRKFNENADAARLVEIGRTPIRLYPNAMMFRKDDVDLRRAVSGALEEIINEGRVDQLIQTYAPGDVLRTALPYEK